MRTITLIVIHCSAVRPGQQSSAKDIAGWHRDRGFQNGIGYHYVVRRDGSIEPGRPLEMIGAHVVGHNRHSIGICYEGGLDEDGYPADTRNALQKHVLLKLLQALRADYPDAEILGHCELPGVQKACSCFLPSEEYKDI